MSEITNIVPLDYSAKTKYSDEELEYLGFILQEILLEDIDILSYRHMKQQWGISNPRQWNQGQKGELEIEYRFKRLGLNAKRAEPYAPFDILLILDDNREIKIEVKTFLHNHEIKVEINGIKRDPDFVICLEHDEDGPDKIYSIHSIRNVLDNRFLTWDNYTAINFNKCIKNKNFWRVDKTAKLKELKK